MLSFPFSGMESLIRREFSKEKQPAWRSSVQGMMLDAECTNQDCEAFNERVIVKLGMTTIDLKYDGDRITCPQCEQRCARGVDDTVLFTACCWKFEGVLADGEKRSAEGRVDDTGSSLLFPHVCTAAFDVVLVEQSFAACAGVYEMERRAEKGSIDVMWKSLCISATPPS